MKKLYVTAACCASIVSSQALAQRSTWVRPTIRSDGTFVQGHMRTAPNATRADNWSSSPNVNPYTGKVGTVDPYAAPKAPAYNPYSPHKPKW